MNNYFLLLKMGVVWAWLLFFLPIKAAPARLTDLHFQSGYQKPGISSGWPHEVETYSPTDV